MQVGSGQQVRRPRLHRASSAGKTPVDWLPSSSSPLAGKEKTSWVPALGLFPSLPRQPGHQAPRTKVGQEGALGGGGGGAILGEPVSVQPMEWEVPSGGSRAESNSRGAVGSRSQAPNQPTEGKEGESSSPWPRSAVADSMARLYAGTRCAASDGGTERLFCWLSMADLCHSHWEGPASPPQPSPDPRRPGTCRLRGAGWRRELCVLRHMQPFSASLEMSKRSQDAVSPRALRREGGERTELGWGEQRAGKGWK